MFMPHAKFHTLEFLRRCNCIVREQHPNAGSYAHLREFWAWKEFFAGYPRELPVFFESSAYPEPNTETMYLAPWLFISVHVAVGLVDGEMPWTLDVSISRLRRVLDARVDDALAAAWALGRSDGVVAVFEAHAS